MNIRFLSILICPSCHGDLLPEGAHLRCEVCAHLFPVQNGIAIFSADKIEVVPAGHNSNSLGAEFEAMLRDGKDLILHIGAGGTATRYENCVEFEHKIFRNTDVVGDAHQLPFRDQVFDRVFAFNVFEHLRDPKTAAAEIFRVLKPSGSVAIHTAFLQALHEEPAHFYNATAYGVREWFTQFEIERCHVSANFSPAYMLAFLMSNVLESVRAAGSSAEEQKLISETSLGQWAHFWAHQSEPPPGFGLLQSLPQHLQQRVAAGFELIARKPAAMEANKS